MNFYIQSSQEQHKSNFSGYVFSGNCLFLAHKNELLACPLFIVRKKRTTIDKNNSLYIQINNKSIFFDKPNGTTMCSIEHLFSNNNCMSVKITKLVEEIVPDVLKKVKELENSQKSDVLEGFLTAELEEQGYRVCRVKKEKNSMQFSTLNIIEKRLCISCEAAVKDDGKVVIYRKKKLDRSRRGYICPVTLDLVNIIDRGENILSDKWLLI